MKTFNLKGTKRQDTGKKSTKTIRSEGNVPCVMYGGEENVHFFIEEKSLKNVVYTSQVYILNIDIDGQVKKGIIQDIQFHPVTDRVVHVDFFEISDSKDVVINIPIELVGNSVGVRNGGKLKFTRRYLKVKGLEANLPDTLKIDISKLNIGSSIKIGDVSFENLTILDPSQAQIVGIVTSRLAAKGMDEEEEEGAEAGTEEGAEAAAETAENKE